MKKFTLTSTLIAVLALTAAGESKFSILSQISAKEKDLHRIQTEISALKGQLTGTSSNKTTYTVKSGDTLSSIARQNEMSYTQLIKWNQISDPSLLQVGQELIVGENSKVAFAKTAAEKKAATPANPFNHTIKNGDTFYSIARVNDISVGKLTQLNPGVNPTRIMSGQKLKVSGSPAAEVQTRSSSAKKSSTSALTRNVTSKKSTATPISTRKKSTPLPAAKMGATPPPTPPKIEESMSATPRSVSSVSLTSETTFSDFASKHRTSTEQLNSLNGWNYPRATLLARGSVIYVPK
ncbi:MAG: LysM peptidoglycan-binding domain-containing protein [Verrucomicrobiales bacterium]|jgi:lysozyme|tara:strand:- start:1631 stop:2512 length:882 start_codon:yes stop_codon:yes gene_type:complete